MARTVYYFDEESRCMKEGYPPQKFPRYGEAPMYISDEMKPYYHPAAQVMVSSKSKLKMIDNACGTFTTDKFQSKSKQVQSEKRAARYREIEEATKKAYEQVKAGQAPLNEEQRALCKRNDEILSSKLGWDVDSLVPTRKKK